MHQHDTLLIACASAETRKMLREILQENYNLLEASNSQQTILLLEQNIQCIAAVILDISDPTTVNQQLLTAPDSVALLTQMPIIVLTADGDEETLDIAFSYGATDAIPLRHNAYSLTRRIENVIQLHLHKLQLETMVAEQAEALRAANDTMVDALSSIIEYRSLESGQHILRIRRFTQVLLEELAMLCPEYGLTEGVIRIISSAAALRDVGKIAISDAILTKPGKLTDEEMELMKSHAATGCQILESMHNSSNEEYLRYAYNICRYHHERWDGSGYPEGLSGDQIPICAQVVGLADAYDALTSKRVYKEAFSFDVAVNMIINGECGVFSPKLIECFKHIAPKYETLAKAYADGTTPEEEVFDPQLPTLSVKEKDSMARIWAKYHALVHYANAFLLELDMDNNLFHLVYNPFPDIVSFNNISSFEDIQRLLLDKLVVPEQWQQMHQFLNGGIADFLSAGLRRTNYRFRFRSKHVPAGEDFELTLLRFNPADNDRNTLAILGRKIANTDEPAPDTTQSEITLARMGISENAYHCRYDKDFTLIALENTTARLAGYTRSELETVFHNRLADLILPEDREFVCNQYRQQFQHSTYAQFEHRVVHKSGRILWVLNKSLLTTDSNGQESLFCYLTDITHTKAEVDELHRKLNRYEIILAQTENVLFEWDIQTDDIMFSDTWKKVFGYPPAAVKFSEALQEASFFHPDDLPALHEKVSNFKRGSSYETAEARIANAGGRYLWCRFRASALRNSSGELYKIVGIIINIDAEKQATQILQDKADRDQLTKLLNKAAGRKRSEKYFAQSEGDVNCALLIIDLDDFKLVNDRYGHLFGDTVLTTVAKEIQKLFRGQDIVSRIGGDEFMVIMRGVSDRGLVEGRCTRLIEALHNHFHTHDQHFPLGCSIGIALAPEHSSTYLELYQFADQALYEAKRRGKSTFAFYDPATFKPQMSATNINHRIDSDDRSRVTLDNLVRFAFQKLYASHDTNAAVNEILALVGRQMNVSRVYIFENSPDNRFCSNTYEWCNEGVLPEMQNLQNISYERDIPGYKEALDEQGIFYCQDVHDLPRKIYDIVAPQGIKSMLHCALRDNGIFRGYLGFDECRTQRFWTKEQIQVLTNFSEMLSVFLMKKQAQARTVQYANDLSSILDNQNAWIYIIDPDTCQLKYVNAKAMALAPDAKVGMTCHKAFFDSDCRCENCPSLNILQDKTASAFFRNNRFHLDALAEATLIQWNGELSCLLTCREAKNNP